jgi:hypothetical protein
MPSITRSSTRSREQVQAPSSTLGSPGATRQVRPNRTNSKSVSFQFDKEVVDILKSPYRHLPYNHLLVKFPALFEGKDKDERKKLNNRYNYLKKVCQDSEALLELSHLHESNPQETSSPPPRVASARNRTPQETPTPTRRPPARKSPPEETPETPTPSRPRGLTYSSSSSSSSVDLPAAEMSSSSQLALRQSSSSSLVEYPEYELDFHAPDKNPYGMIVKLCGKKQIPGENERSELCRIFYICRDTRDMMQTRATLSDDGLHIVVEEPSAPTFMIAEATKGADGVEGTETSDLFCEQMGIDDENEKQDWSTWAFGVKTNRPTKKSIYHLPAKCTLDFNEGMQNFKLKSNYKFSTHNVPASRKSVRVEKTPIIMWCLGVDGTREPFAPTADDTHDDFFNQISDGVSNMGIA